MNLKKQTIFTGFAPNLTAKDVRKATSFLTLPWKWPYLRSGEYVNKVEDWLKNYFGIKQAVTFDSGRTALYFALKTLGVGEGDEVLVQGYTCVVVSNAINWTGAKPVYVDVNDNFNINPDELAKKITDRSKVLIIQHTFGQPADLGKLIEVANEHRLKVIEDCAHSLGVKVNGRYTGTLGDIGMLSFGSDKSVSCARGGALITNNEDLARKILQYQSMLKGSSINKILQHLTHFRAFGIGKPLYHLGIGKWLLWATKKFNLVSKIIYKEEKVGKNISSYPSKLPNALAAILINQLNDLDKVNTHRAQIAKLYSSTIKNSKVRLPIFDQDAIPLRFPLLTENPRRLHSWAKEQGIILGDWYNSVVAPTDVLLDNTGYKIGDCPNAERLASKSINLPTNRNINSGDAQRIINVVNSYESS